MLARSSKPSEGKGVFGRFAHLLIETAVFFNQLGFQMEDSQSGEDFEAGDVVVCVTNDHLNLTEGKEYITVGKEQGSSFIDILDDRGRLGSYLKRRFKRKSVDPNHEMIAADETEAAARWKKWMEWREKSAALAKGPCSKPRPQTPKGIIGWR